MQYPFHWACFTVDNMFNVSDLILNECAISPHDKLCKAASKIAFHNFEWRLFTLVIFNSTLSCAAQRFGQSFKQPIILVKGLHYPSYAEITKQFVMFGTDVSNIEVMLNWMRGELFDNTGKYIVICQSEESAACDEWKAIDMFWNYKIIDVVFLKSVGNTVIGYTYFPFSQNCDNGGPTRIPDLDVCITSSKKCDQYFPLKLKNLHKCELIVSTFKQVPYMIITNGKATGIDGDLLGIIGERLNASLKVMTPRDGFGWGTQLDNGSWTGSLSDVYYDLANLSMTSAAITLSRFNHFSMSIDYYTKLVVWIMHPAKLKPSSLKLLQPFQPIVQIALIISFVLVFFCALFTKTTIWKSLTPKVEANQSQSNVVLFSWMICMGLPATKLPTKSTMMYIVLFWVWYCILVRTFYQAVLITVLRSDYYYDGLETIEDVIAAKYPFGGGHGLKYYYTDYPDIYNEWTSVAVQDIIPTMFNISQGLKFVLALDMQKVRSNIHEYNIALNILPQRIVNSPTVIFFKKYSPLVKPVNRILRKLLETGISNKFYKNHAGVKKVPKSSGSHEPINLNHYSGCYTILMLGWVVSFGIFLAEVYIGKFFRNKTIDHLVHEK